MNICHCGNKMCGNFFHVGKIFFCTIFFNENNYKGSFVKAQPTQFEPTKPSPLVAVGTTLVLLPLLSISLSLLSISLSSTEQPPLSVPHRATVVRIFPSGYTSPGYTAPAVVPTTATRTPPHRALSAVRSAQIHRNSSPHRATVLPSPNATAAECAAATVAVDHQRYPPLSHSSLGFGG